MEFKEIIKKQRELLDLTLDEVARYVGVSGATVSRWESGEIINIRRDKIYKLSEILQVTPDYLMGWTSGSNNQNADKFDNIFQINVKRFPLLGEVACGQPIFANQEFESYVIAGADIQADFCIKAKGNSMINARIYDGDIVFIRKQEIVSNGEIAAVIVEDEATLKRVYYYPSQQKLLLNAENPQYEPLIYIGEELNHIRILGKAVAFQSDIR